MKTLPRGSVKWLMAFGPVLILPDVWGAEAEPQERGQAVLKQMAEVNSFWLLRAPEAVTNWSYEFHLFKGGETGSAYDKSPVRIAEPGKESQRRRQGVTYSSLVHSLARHPERAQVNGIAETNGQLVLSLTVLPDKNGKQTGSSSLDPAFRGECGNGIKGSWYGYFSFGGGEAELTVDPKKMVPLKSSVKIIKSKKVVQEVFSDFTEITPGHYAPLTLGVTNGPMQFVWKFKVHEDGLWLLDEARMDDQKVAWLDHVLVNRPLTELAAEPTAPARAETAKGPKQPPVYQTLTTNSVEVSYSGISEKYALAISRTIATARSLASAWFGFDMPEQIGVRVTVDPDRAVSLWTDGESQFFLDVRSEAGMERPARTGTFHIYGFCHETGHLAMYRLLKNCEWMRGTAKEAWAHYLGSRITDLVYERCGPELWPDSYDYRADGMARLNSMLAESDGTDPYNQAVRAWKELVTLTGDKGVAPLFVAWNCAPIDPLDPGAAIRQTLAAHAKAKELTKWWAKYEPFLIEKIEKSPFAAQVATPGELIGRPVELAIDNGHADGQRSISGSGHSVRLLAPGTNCFLTEVRVFGCRYGEPEPPKEDFHVWLCDKDFKPIAHFSFPYSSFPYAEQPAKWVTLKVRPTSVPRDFVLNVTFNPTATKGIYAHFDKSDGGQSFTGLPGHKQDSFEQGNWLLRAVVERKGSAE